MSKIIFTIDKFDCLNQSHFHLIKEMRKLALPDGEIIAVIFDDYSCFVNNRQFPIQDLSHRKNNLEFLVKDFLQCFTNDPSPVILALIDRAKKENKRLIYVGYEDNKSFIGRETLAKANISMRFIKKYAK